MAKMKNVTDIIWDNIGLKLDHINKRIEILNIKWNLFMDGEIANCFDDVDFNTDTESEINDDINLLEQEWEYWYDYRDLTIDETRDEKRITEMLYFFESIEEYEICAFLKNKL